MTPRSRLPDILIFGFSDSRIAGLNSRSKQKPTEGRQEQVSIDKTRRVVCTPAVLGMLLLCAYFLSPCVSGSPKNFI